MLKSKANIFFRTLGFAALLSAAMICTSTAHGGIVIYVHDDASPGNDGLSWETGFRYLQDALTYASSPKNNVSEIHVAIGIYRSDRDELNPSGTGDRAATFQLINNVAVMGGYAGAGAKDPDDRDIELYETFLSGDLLGDDEADFKNNNENSYHVITANNTDDTAVLDGFTITAGNANASFPDSAGGGCFSQAGLYTMHSCLFIENFALVGGAIYNGSSDPTFTSCTFQNNTANSSGGGMYNDTSNPTITACQFLGNTSLTLDGGAMLNDAGSDAMIVESLFSGNSADRHGGGIRNTLSNPSFIDSVFASNSATNGGGMYNYQCNPPLNSCTFTENFASDGGGLFNNQSSPLTTDCTFSENNAGGGGAISNIQMSSPLISGCEFIANEAGAGGAILNNSESSPNIFMCTFIANVASSNIGGAIASGASLMRVDRCLFDGNSSRKRGGAIYNANDSNTVFTRCVFINNQSINPNSTDGEGGAIYNLGATIALINCEMVANSSRQGGGALYNWSATMDVQNCLIANNEVLFDEGGAVYNLGGGMMIMTNCTIALNTAVTSGGAVHSTSGLVSLTNCIVWDNLPDETSGAAIAVNYSTITGGFDGTGNINANPIFVNTDNGDFRISPTSPCIDAANNAAVPLDDYDLDDDKDNAEQLPIDLDGSPRFLDDVFTDDTGKGQAPIVDMGAYEFIVDCNNNGVPDAIDILKGTSEDCNENNIPDECDVVPPFFAESGQLGPIGFDSPQSFMVETPPVAFADVTLAFTAFADLLSVIEFIEVDLNGIVLGNIFVKDAHDCPETPDLDEIVVPVVEYNNAVAGGDAIITMTATNTVNSIACDGNNYITVALQYSLGGSSDDLNDNGIPDECETPGDLDGDGVIGTSDLLILLSSWGLCDDCDNCVADLDGDCNVGTSDLLTLLSNWG